MKRQFGYYISEEGQTLLEVLLAFSVSIMVLSAIIFGVTTSLSNAQYSKNQGLANSYAQEGLAAVRKLRDSNWAVFSNYLSSTKYCIDKNLSLQQISSSIECVDNNAIGLGGIFSRYVNFEPNSISCKANPACVDPGCLKGNLVIVTVSWSDNKCPAATPPSLCHKVDLSTCFSNVETKDI